MDIELIKQIIVEYQQFIASVELVARDYAFEPDGKYVMVGLRQAGKSYLLYQRARQLVAEGHAPEEICYVNFDDERLAGMTAAELDRILVAYRALYPGEPILFFDEIQNVVGWERFARRLANEKYRVFITGSNAKMLSREIASTLGARYLTQEVMPYSFGEYLRANGVELKGNGLYGRVADKVARLFEPYFRFGGFPESLHYANRRAWLNGLFGRIFFNDMVVRNGVKNEEALRLTVKKVAESVGQPMACNRIANLVKAAGVSTSTVSVQDYLGFMRESCILFSIPNFAAKFSERESVKKHYFADNGLLNIFLLNPDSALLENLCAIELRRRFGERLMFYRHNVEVDFYVPDEGLAVQACWAVSDEATLRREVAALEKLDAHAPLRRLVIVTRNDNGSIALDNGKAIEIVDAARWLLESSAPERRSR